MPLILLERGVQTCADRYMGGDYLRYTRGSDVRLRLVHHTSPESEVVEAS